MTTVTKEGLVSVGEIAKDALEGTDDRGTNEHNLELGESLVERLTRDPSVPVDKLERILKLQQDAAQEAARRAFNAAMNDVQSELRPISADASNPQTHSKYASYAALDNAVRPVYTSHGFGLSFNTGTADRDGYIRVVCLVTHREGYEREYHIDMPADGKGAKGADVMTLTHAVGAGMAYGMRYLLKAIWNLAVGEDDRDGNAPKQTTLKEPKGFQEWKTTLGATAKTGGKKLAQAWKESRGDYRLYFLATESESWDDLKTVADDHDREGQ